MQQLETRGITDSWIKGSWEEYLAAINNFPENKGKSYYYNGYYYTNYINNSMIIIIIIIIITLHECNSV
jgi:hypothetical protein